MMSRPEIAEALDAAKRASIRSAATTHRDMKWGLNSLATIASTALGLGILGTLEGIVSSFRGCDGEKSALMAALIESLSESLVPCAIGVMVAVVTMWLYKYLLTEVETFDVEMKNSSLQMMNALSRL